MDYIIRRARREDLDQVDRLYDELFKMMSSLEPFYIQEAKQDRDFLWASLAGEGLQLFVADRQGEILGFVVMSQDQTLDYSFLVRRNYAYLADIYVKERGRGIGRGLIEAGIAWARERDLDYVSLGVLEKNKGAERLYEDLGFSRMSSDMYLKLRED